MAKKQKTTLRSPEDAANCLKELKDALIRISILEADTNAAVLRIQEASREKMLPLLERRNSLELDLSLYVNENRSLFAKARQIVTQFGKYGLRKLPPSVVTLKKVKIGDVIARMREQILTLRRHVKSGQPYVDDDLQAMSARLTVLERFLKVKESLDKEQVLAAYREGKIGDDALRDYGLAIETDNEEFTYTIDFETTEN